MSGAATPSARLVKQNLAEMRGVKCFESYIVDGTIVKGYKHTQNHDGKLKNVRCAGYFEKTGYYIAATDKSLYVSDRGNSESLDKIGDYPMTSPFMIEMVEQEIYQVLLFTDDRYFRLTADGDYVVAEYGGRLSCGTMCKGRLFGADLDDGLKLKWSGRKGYTDWLQDIYNAGYVYLDPAAGNILDVFDFEGGLVILRERGITLFAVGGTPEDFKIVKTIALPATVYPHTAAIIDRYIYFCTDFGVFRYRGGVAERLEGDIENDIGYVSCAIAYQNRYYVISGRSEIIGHNLILIYDVMTRTAQYVDVYALCIGAEKNRLVCYGATTTYLIGNTASGVHVKIYNLDFGTHGRKLLKYIECECTGKGQLEIHIDADGNYSRIYTSKSKMMLNLRGKSFFAEVISDYPITHLALAAEVTE